MIFLCEYGAVWKPGGEQVNMSHWVHKTLLCIDAVFWKGRGSYSDGAVILSCVLVPLSLHLFPC